jgi:hypothetical protein
MFQLEQHNRGLAVTDCRWRHRMALPVLLALYRIEPDAAVNFDVRCSRCSDFYAVRSYLHSG